MHPITRAVIAAGNTLPPESRGFYLVVLRVSGLNLSASATEQIADALEITETPLIDDLWASWVVASMTEDDETALRISEELEMHGIYATAITSLGGIALLNILLRAARRIEPCHSFH